MQIKSFFEKYPYCFLVLISNFLSAQPQSEIPLSMPLPGTQNYDYEARDRILMNNGFEYTPYGNNNLFAHINESLIVPASYSSFPDPTVPYQINNNFPVGAVNASIDVSPTGAATFNIPVFIPPGSGGMQPQISAAYNSQGGNGSMGIGWDVAGLSAITRVPQSLYYDNNITPINLTYDDRYSLDGQRLILYGTYYKTEIESFLKVQPFYGSIGNPDYFIVTTKDGTTLEYGNSSDSRIESQGSSIPYMWRLNKVTDLNGNYMEYFYHEINGESWIERIEYTKNDAAGITSYYNAIKFYYETRSDQNKFFVAGSEINQTVLLHAIRSEAEGIVVREFQFKYALGISYSHLTEIVELGSDRKQLNSTIVYWGDASAQLDQTAISDSYFAYNKSVLCGDFNGDGKTDVLIFPEKEIDDYEDTDLYKIYKSNGDGTFNAGPSNFFHYDNFVPSLTKIGDLNADGNDDILMCFLDNDGGDEIFRFIPVFCNGYSFDEQLHQLFQLEQNITHHFN